MSGCVCDLFSKPGNKKPPSLFLFGLQCRAARMAKGQHEINMGVNIPNANSQCSACQSFDGALHKV